VTGQAISKGCLAFFPMMVFSSTDSSSLTGNLDNCAPEKEMRSHEGVGKRVPMGSLIDFPEEAIL
jgi:hypothetical protein